MTIDVLKVEYHIINGENVDSYANLVMGEMVCENQISFMVLVVTWLWKS